MIFFEPFPTRPQELDGKAARMWEDSVYVWKVRYGSGDDPNNHIDLAYLGLAPLDILTCRGYWWLDPIIEQERVTRAMLRDAKLAFRTLEAGLGWTTYAHTEVRLPHTGRFARFFNFRSLGTNDGQEYHEGPLK